MSSRFVENLHEVPITHPHLNVSLDDILAEERRKRSVSASSSTSATSSSRSSADAATSPVSPIIEKATTTRKRGFTFGSRKDR